MQIVWIFLSNKRIDQNEIKIYFQNVNYQYLNFKLHNMYINF